MGPQCPLVIKESIFLRHSESGNLSNLFYSFEFQSKQNSLLEKLSPEDLQSKCIFKNIFLVLHISEHSKVVPSRTEKGSYGNKLENNSLRAA